MQGSKGASAKKQLLELKKGVVDLISERELLDKLQAGPKKRPLRIKAGFDPTNPDLHLGHLVLLNKLKQFQDLGHKVIFLIGDFTSTIGDPSGRNVTRPNLTKDKIRHNSKTYHEQVFKVLDKNSTEVRHNTEWMDKFSCSDLINLMSEYTVARMIERDDFQNRLSQGIPLSIHELVYPLVQGYDSVVLKSDVEIGGTDQKFNLLVGRDLQKSNNQKPQCVMTLPLLEGTDGKMKMSKSYGNYIALNSSYKEMFGKIMSIPDTLLIKYFELLTDLTTGEIAKLKLDLDNGKNPRDIKVSLGKMLVSKFHSKADALKAEDEFFKVFKEGGLPDNIPEVHVTEQNVWICKLLCDVKLGSSNSDSKRLIQGGGVKLDGNKVSDTDLKLDLKKGEKLLLSVGKRKFVNVVVK